MGVLLWIGTVLLGIACVFVVLGGLAAQNPTLLVLAAVYIVMTIVYGLLARSLTTYASKINLLNASEKVRDLEDALEAQKTFWRLVGILTLTGIVLYILLMVLMVSGIMLTGNFMQR